MQNILISRTAALFALLAFASLLASILFAPGAVRPILGVVKERHQSPFYFAHILEWEPNEYAENFLRQSPIEMHYALSLEVYAKAKLANSKFIKIRSKSSLLAVRRVKP